jgi:hypothetical protein
MLGAEEKPFEHKCGNGKVNQLEHYYYIAMYIHNAPNCACVQTHANRPLCISARSWSAKGAHAYAVWVVTESRLDSLLFHIQPDDQRSNYRGPTARLLFEILGSKNKER